MSPVDALGAMARSAQVVVVGDDKQLPPTRFFSKMLDEDEAQGDGDDLNAGDLESILGLCVAQGMSQRMLRWHYRSRHHSLIAVSNREFYDSRLFVVPSPTTVTAMHGLHFRPVKGGVFDRGGTATNRVEARAVAGAVIEHARRYPRQSLGVGAFSVSQRDAIRDELEVLQREHVELAPFFSTGRPEPFFVKNLENIQGDERDVIFISVGYARDPSGYMAMNFGPLSSQGGERRLNVLISRARERCEVFSSITADDIDLQRAKSRGAAAFKTFLRYAATGVLDSQAPTGGDYDSDFERQVAVALEGLGHEVHRQVGTAGFIIDLAVVDPSKPGRYLLGIECDGATYHSSRSARDRDRLREAVLRDRGWKIHRVWSTDWFHRPGRAVAEGRRRDREGSDRRGRRRGRPGSSRTLSRWTSNPRTPRSNGSEEPGDDERRGRLLLGIALRGSEAGSPQIDADPRDEPVRPGGRRGGRGHDRRTDPQGGDRAGGSPRSGGTRGPGLASRKPSRRRSRRASAREPCVPNRTSSPTASSRPSRSATGPRSRRRT